MTNRSVISTHFVSDAELGIASLLVTDSVWGNHYATEGTDVTRQPAPARGLPDAQRLGNQRKASDHVSRRVVGREAVEEARPRVTAALPSGCGDVSALHLALRAARLLSVC